MWINDSLGGIVLWENPNPENEFPEQDIALASADYDYYEVFCLQFPFGTANNLTVYSKGIRGEGVFLGVFSANDNILTVQNRSITYKSDTVLNIGFCHSGVILGNNYSHSTNSIRIIPLKVMGYKKL